MFLGYGGFFSPHVTAKVVYYCYLFFYGGVPFNSVSFVIAVASLVLTIVGIINALKAARKAKEAAEEAKISTDVAKDVSEKMDSVIKQLNFYENIRKELTEQLTEEKRIFNESEKVKLLNGLLIRIKYWLNDKDQIKEIDECIDKLNNHRLFGRDLEKEIGIAEGLAQSGIDRIGFVVATGNIPNENN